MSTVSPTLRPVDGVDVDALRTFLDGRWAWVRDQAREVTSRPLFDPVADLPTCEYQRVPLRCVA